MSSARGERANGRPPEKPSISSAARCQTTRQASPVAMTVARMTVTVAPMTVAPVSVPVSVSRTDVEIEPRAIFAVVAAMLVSTMPPAASRSLLDKRGAGSPCLVPENSDGRGGRCRRREDTQRQRND